MNVFNAGDLDRQVTILVRTVAAEDVYGTDAGTFAPFVTLPAQIIEAAPSRADHLGKDIVLAHLPATVRIRWRGDIAPEHRVSIDGQEMRIVGGPAMIGRRVGLELMVERVTTEGQQP